MLGWLVFIPVITTLSCIALYRRETGSFPRSLSATSLYGPFGRVVFVVGCMLMAACSWLSCTELVSDGLLWMAWLSCAGLMFVAANPLKEDGEDTMHMVSAWFSGITMSVMSFFVNPLSALVWVLYFLYIAVSDRKCSVLVAELCVVIQFTLSLFLPSMS